MLEYIQARDYTREIVMLIDELIDSLETELSHRPLKAAEICIGVFYTAVRLSNNYVGTAFTPRDLSDTVCCPRSAKELPEAGHLSGRDAWELARQATSPFRLRRAIGIATLNALSACLMSRKAIPEGEIITKADALDMVKIEAADKIVMVGAFIPFIQKLRKQGANLRIIDKHPESLKKDELSLWVSPDSIGEVLPQADIAIITGSALVEGGFDELLQLCSNAREIIMAGPTASLWPEPFFSRGVTVLGGIKVNNASGFMRLVAEGGSGYFFSGPAEKIAIIKTKRPVAVH